MDFMVEELESQRFRRKSHADQLAIPPPRSDHWPGCFTSVLVGGGIKGGLVYGQSDKHAAYPALNPVSPADLIATV